MQRDFGRPGGYGAHHQGRGSGRCQAHSAILPGRWFRTGPGRWPCAGHGRWFRTGPGRWPCAWRGRWPRAWRRAAGQVFHDIRLSPGQLSRQCHDDSTQLPQIQMRAYRRGVVRRKRDSASAWDPCAGEPRVTLAVTTQVPASGSVFPLGCGRPLPDRAGFGKQVLKCPVSECIGTRRPRPADCWGLGQSGPAPVAPEVLACLGRYRKFRRQRRCPRRHWWRSVRCATGRPGQRLRRGRAGSGCQRRCPLSRSVGCTASRPGLGFRCAGWNRRRHRRRPGRPGVRWPVGGAVRGPVPSVTSGPDPIADCGYHSGDAECPAGQDPGHSVSRSDLAPEGTSSGSIAAAAPARPYGERLPNRRGDRCLQPWSPLSLPRTILIIFGRARTACLPAGRPSMDWARLLTATTGAWDGFSRFWPQESCAGPRLSPGRNSAAPPMAATSWIGGAMVMDTNRTCRALSA